MIYRKSGTTGLNPQRHISSAIPLWEPQTHKINTLWVQCKVLSVTSSRTRENFLALKETVNIHYRRYASFFCTWPDVKSLSWTRRTVVILTLLLRILKIPQIEDELQFWKIIFQGKNSQYKNTSQFLKFIIFLARPPVLVGSLCVWGFENWKTLSRIYDEL